LIVEDEPTIAAALQDDLEIEGYAVEVAKDGASALERALKNNYDLILLDIMLPRKDGFTVCRELRMAGKRTPVIMLTAKGQEIDKVLGLELGADDYVTKPFSPRELKARIKAMLRRAAPAEVGEEGPQVFEFGDVRVDFKRCELRRAGKKVELTAMEFKLLRMFLTHRGEPRALAATAQYRIGLCYEKLGNTEARKAFERVLTTYQDQKDTVALARVRLNALESAAPRTAEAKGLSLRQIKVDPRFMGPPSPDGRYLAYADKEGDVSVYDLNTETTRKLTHRDLNGKEYAEPDDFAWSPEGSRIAYAWKNQEGFYDLRVIGLNGSTPRVLHAKKDTSYSSSPLSWFPDGKSILVKIYLKDPYCQISRVSIEDGNIQNIATFNKSEPRPPVRMALSPDGQFIVYEIRSGTAGATRTDFYLIPATGGTRIEIVSEKCWAELFGWDVDGRSILFTSDRTGSRGLWRMQVTKGKPQGEVELVKANV